jgi:HEAT repeat protein
LTNSAQNEDIRRQAAKSLVRISYSHEESNEQANVALLDLTQYTQNRWILEAVSDNLSYRLSFSFTKIHFFKEIFSKFGDEAAITICMNLMKNTNLITQNYVCKQVAEELEKISAESDTIYEKVISGFVKLIETSQNEYARWQAIESLGRIHANNEQTISALVEVMKTTQDGDIRKQAAETLAIVGIANKKAISASVELLETVGTEDVLWQAVDILGRIGIGNQEAISGLEKLIKTTQNEPLSLQAAHKLWKIDSGNEQALIALKRLLTVPPIQATEAVNTSEKTINNSRHDFTCKKDIDKILNEDDQGCKLATQRSDENDEVIEEDDPRIGDQSLIATLVKTLETAQDSEEHQQCIKDLGNFGIGSREAANALINIISTKDFPSNWQLAAASLQKILQDQLFSVVVSSLKTFVGDQIYHKDPEYYRICYEVIWYCAQNMSYPNFYQVWKDDKRM